MKTFAYTTKASIVKLVSGLLLLSCIILVGSAYWIGLEVENLSKIPQPGWQITQLKRGWLSSDADSRLLINEPVLAVRELPLQHKIYHGPLPLFNWPIPALTIINTTLAPGAYQQLQSFELSSDQEPLSVVSQLSFDQTMQHTIRLAPIRSKTALGSIDYFAFAGLDGSMQLSTLGQLSTADVQIRKFQLGSQISDFSINLDQLKLALSPDDTTASHYQLELIAELDSLKLRQESVQSGTLQLSIMSLHQPALVQLTQSASGTELLALPKLLQSKPRVQLHELSLQTSRGQLSVQADLSLREFSLLRLFGALDSLLAAMIEQADAEIMVDQRLLERIISKQQLTHWRDAGFIKLSDNIYHCKIRLYNKQLRLNEVQLTLP